MGLEITLVGNMITLDIEPDEHGELSPQHTPEEPCQNATAPVAQDISVTIDDSDLLVSFIQESQDHLENVERKILGLEGNADPDTVNEIFRCMHTIKGNSSFLRLEKIQVLSHALESVLQGMPAGSGITYPVREAKDGKAPLW